MKSKFLVQLFKYGLVGLFNTLLTALCIWFVLARIVGVQEGEKASDLAMFFANIVGYSLGLINSYIFNRNWTFQSREGWKSGFLKFLLGFVICYLIQLGLIIYLNKMDVIADFPLLILGHSYAISSSFSCQMIGVVAYTILNFLFNKYYTFRNQGTK